MLLCLLFFIHLKEILPFNLALMMKRVYSRKVLQKRVHCGLRLSPMKSEVIGSEADSNRAKVNSSLLYEVPNKSQKLRGILSNSEINQDHRNGKLHFNLHVSDTDHSDVRLHPILNDCLGSPHYHRFTVSVEYEHPSSSPPSLRPVLWRFPWKCLVWGKQVKSTYCLQMIVDNDSVLFVNSCTLIDDFFQICFLFKPHHQIFNRTKSPALEFTTRWL